jgi:hypothetical protein
MALTQTQLRLHKALQEQRFDVKIEQTEDKWFICSIRGATDNEEHYIETARGATKRWRHPEDAIAFVFDYFPAFRKLILNISNLEFVLNTR